MMTTSAMRTGMPPAIGVMIVDATEVCDAPAAGTPDHHLQIPRHRTTPALALTAEATADPHGERNTAHKGNPKGALSERIQEPILNYQKRE